MEAMVTGLSLEVDDGKLMVLALSLRKRAPDEWPQGLSGSLYGCL